MAERFYPQFLWCNLYGAWCDDVPEITDGENECNGDCRGCEESEDVDKIGGKAVRRFG